MVQRDRIVDRAADPFLDKLDATFLALAIRNVLRAAKWAAKLESEPVAAALEAFDRRVPNAIAIRDMLEHFDDYDRGIGILQGNGPVGTFRIAATRVDDQYVLHVALGFALDVQSSVIAVTQLADDVQVALCVESHRPAH